ncbi:MAG: copper amine oxidase N-terminal domain-containing protein [Clostridia bacterium]|nr:copper amine oxidase N-terminal domain-containing protein [Clostridia bacterium]MBR6523295.1 copper amine oxidase N-terminal domain-containing protein [Clostridia bacterium]
MKKLVSITLVFCLLLSMTAFAANTEIYINGEKAAIAEGMGSIVEKDNRTFVPIRFLLEHFQYQVSWQDAEQMVFGAGPNGEIFVMQVGSELLFFKDAENNEKKITMDVSPFLNLAEGRTYVPIRFIADAMGYEVGWDGATQTVTLTK